MMMVRHAWRCPPYPGRRGIELEAPAAYFETPDGFTECLDSGCIQAIYGFRNAG